jgi:hypothetical protein
MSKQSRSVAGRPVYPWEWAPRAYSAGMTSRPHAHRFVALTFVAAVVLLSGAAMPHAASSDCSVGKALFDLAWKANIRVGFEALAGCIPSPRERPRPIAGRALGTASPPSELLDTLMAIAPEFSWRAIGDVFVVRPQSAWDDRGDFLNFQTAAFNTAGIDLDSALRTLIQHVSPTVYHPYTVVKEPVGSVSVTFAGGHMIDALNALISAGQFNEWEIGYAGVATVIVRSHDLDAGVAMAPLNVPLATR